MNTRILRLLAALCLALPAAALADDRPEHYQGAPARNLDEAMANLESYNERLAGLLQQDELSAEDMAKVHKLSYTLENAVGRMRTELDELAATLEQVHLASERADKETVSEKGRAFLNKAKKFTP